MFGSLLLTEENVEDAPSEPTRAFAYLVEIARQNLSAFANHTKLTVQPGFGQYEELCYGFANLVVALAREYHVTSLLADRNLSPLSSFTVTEFRQFLADLDAVQSRLLLGNTATGRRESVVLLPAAKDKIRDYIRAIRQAIDDADLTEKKKAELHEKLTDFELALDKKRLNLAATMLFVLAIVAVPGELGASFDVVNNLMQRVVSLVAEAKLADDENRRLPATEAPAALLPPRPGDFGRKPSRPDGESLADELDDDIPF